MVSADKSRSETCIFKHLFPKRSISNTTEEQTTFTTYHIKKARIHEGKDDQITQSDYKKTVTRIQDCSKILLIISYGLWNTFVFFPPSQSELSLLKLFCSLKHLYVKGTAQLYLLCV